MMQKPQLLTTIRIITLIAIFSLGKMIAATGQTLFGMKHATAYLFKNGNSVDPVNMTLIGCAALCSLVVILTTRVPAISRQFRTSVKPQIDISLGRDISLFRRTIFSGLMFCSCASGVFSAIGAYLSTITLTEFMRLFFYSDAINFNSNYVQIFAIFVAASTFVSYYSFNYYKSRQNAIKIVSTTHTSHGCMFRHRNVNKTICVSLLSLFSIPFLSYFLTKHALLSMPYIGTFLSLSLIKYVATGSAITALITCLITNIPATYEYFVEKEQKEDARMVGMISDTTGWAWLRSLTYSAGFIDCTANGLSNFVSVIDVAHDAFSANLYGNIIFLAIGSGVSSALLTAAFSVRQGFNDFINDYQDDMAHERDKLLKVSSSI